MFSISIVGWHAVMIGSLSLMIRPVMLLRIVHVGIVGHARPSRILLWAPVLLSPVKLLYVCMLNSLPMQI